MSHQIVFAYFLVCSQQTIGSSWAGTFFSLFLVYSFVWILLLTHVLGMKKKCLQKNHRTDRFAVTLLGAALAQDNGNVLEGDYLLLAGLMEGS